MRARGRGNGGTAAALKAGALAFAIVFAAGFALGTVRVLWIAPRLGPLGAVLLELPVMLAVSWWAVRLAVRRLAVPEAAVARAAMGGVAFALLIGAETLLGVVAFGRSPAEQWQALLAPEGLAGLAAQVLFGLFPLWAGDGSAAGTRRSG